METKDKRVDPDKEFVMALIEGCSDVLIEDIDTLRLDINHGEKDFEIIVNVHFYFPLTAENTANIHALFKKRMLPEKSF